MIKNKDLKRRIIEISYKHNLSHLGSCLTAVDIIDDIYRTKKKDEKFILSSGHAGLALYVVLEKYEGYDAENLFQLMGVHPDRMVGSEAGNMWKNPISVSTGSLGHGLPIALGMALADKSKNVYCLISDGECAEGSIWEALRIIDESELENIGVYINYNGYSAYDQISREDLTSRIRSFDWRGDHEIWRSTYNELPFLKGLDAHYHIMNEDEYKQAMEVLK